MPDERLGQAGDKEENGEEIGENQLKERTDTGGRGQGSRSCHY